MKRLKAQHLEELLKNSSNAETCRAHWCCSHTTEAQWGKLTDRAANQPYKIQPECGAFILCSIKGPCLQWQRAHSRLLVSGTQEDWKGWASLFMWRIHEEWKGEAGITPCISSRVSPSPLHLGFTAAGKIKAEVWKLLSQVMSGGPQRGCHSTRARGQNLVLRQSWADTAGWGQAGHGHCRHRREALAAGHRALPRKDEEPEAFCIKRTVESFSFAHKDKKPEVFCLAD